ncbi:MULTISPECIES: acyltransferase [Micromonospora]|uniref:Acyltransferase n=1 Tax=Micromonospora solifontis TaxID=2487138 RepID=A0ABX9WEC7_9ACTN|nr:MULTISPECIES: acyltransferase [Micromonospora]NES15009.1 acyltransferase [Micromonospora sp. PPF5-17B]NES37568.1 acyltransferase [Micromonospora solifontis]NES57534.1 acyltransferase [Micromonospora sp. PPF5-6]RNL98189.1 acyltransferase [Micromonospora solifontis]
MRRLRQLAERTPAGRERYVDLLRALAITMVVLGHWGITVIGYDRAGRPTGHSALGDLPWVWPLTWVGQVMPVFFLVGGYANAASLTARRRRGGDATGWLVDRSARLVRPTTALLVVLAVGAAVASLRHADPVQVRTVVWFATIPLWFLVAYLVVVPLTPPMYALHRRFGRAVPAVLVGFVALGDLGRLLGPAGLATGNYLFGWLAIHQLGFAWYDARTPDLPRRRRLPLTRRAGAVLLAAGLAALVLLTVVGPYPVVMLNVPGTRLDNAAPPSLALLAAATAQLGLILLLRGPAERWLRRCRPWQAVIAVNSVVLTVFLWHLTAAVLLIGLLDALGALPTPRVGSAAWWAWRIPWVLALAVVLAALVAVFGPIEARSRRHPTGAAPTRPWRTGLAAGGYAGIVAGLLLNSLTRKVAAEPLGLPAPALVAYLAGAGALRLLRSGSGSRGSPRRAVDPATGS